MPKKIIGSFVLAVILLLTTATAVAFAAPIEGTAEEALLHRQAIITLVVLAVAAVLFITELIPLAVTSMCIPVVLALTGVVTEKEAFSGLANSNVILFAGMFVVGAALFETGVAKWIGDTVVRLKSEAKRS